MASLTSLQPPHSQCSSASITSSQFYPHGSNSGFPFSLSQPITLTLTPVQNTAASTTAGLSPSNLTDVRCLTLTPLDGSASLWETVNNNNNNNGQQQPLFAYTPAYTSSSTSDGVSYPPNSMVIPASFFSQPNAAVKNEEVGTQTQQNGMNLSIAAPPPCPPPITIHRLNAVSNFDVELQPLHQQHFHFDDSTLVNRLLPSYYPEEHSFTQQDRAVPPLRIQLDGCPLPVPPLRIPSLELHHRGDKSMAKSRSSKRGAKKKMYQCDVCLKNFEHKSSLQRHERTHTGEKPFVCKITSCAKRFADSSALYKHNIVHTKERRFLCHLCGKKFGYNHVLKRHIKSIHENQKRTH